ncbi:MAG: hypothetical protein ACLQLG_00335 [Thermoguttaceae bacterium]
MTAKLTNPVFVSWYLSAVFALGVLASSVIDVAPGHETLPNAAMAACLVAALFFLVLAIALQSRGRRGLSLGVFRSGSFRLGYAVFAFIVTLFLLAIVAG